MSYVLGSFMDWNVLALTCGCVAGLSLLLLTFSPDPPSWLVDKSKHDNAYGVLKRLHGSKEASQLLQSIQANAARQAVKQRGPNKPRLNLGTIKASAVALGILSFQQLTGACNTWTSSPVLRSF